MFYFRSSALGVACVLVTMMAGCADKPRHPTLAWHGDVQNPDTEVCVRRVKTGSRIQTTECRADRDWAADAAEGRAYQARMNGYRSLLLPR